MQRSDFDQWGEIIIAVVIVLGSVFGAVSKKLIKVFSPKPPETPGMPEQPTRPMVEVRGMPGRVEPVRPVARPAASMPTSRSAPTARPAPTVWPATPGERLASPVKPVPQEAPVHRTPQRVERGLPSAQPIARRARPATTRAKPPSTAPKGLDATVEEHLGHLHSTLEGEGKRVGRSVEERIGHVETHIPAAEKATHKPHRHPVLGVTNQASLRHAVLMREILGPPVALRDSSDAW